MNLTATDEHTTKVKLEGYSAAFLEAMKKAKVEAKIKLEAREKAETQEKAKPAKALEATSKQQDDMINDAIRKALSESATSSSASPKKP